MQRDAEVIEALNATVELRLRFGFGSALYN
jgi:hypothetical protein